MTGIIYGVVDGISSIRMPTIKKTRTNKGWIVCLVVLILILMALILVWLKYPTPLGETTTTTTTTTTIRLSGDLPAIPLSMPPTGAEPVNLPKERS